MAYKISVIILSLSFLLIVRKYWKAKEEKDTCYLNLDKHVKYIKEFQAEAQENKLVFERNIKNQESEIEETKKDKINTESKLRFCENQNKNQLSDLRFKSSFFILQPQFFIFISFSTSQHQIQFSKF